MMFLFVEKCIFITRYHALRTTATTHVNINRVTKKQRNKETKKQRNKEIKKQRKRIRMKMKETEGGRETER
jgi:hypothetical protein